jgi:hypothetical protein
VLLLELSLELVLEDELLLEELELVLPVDEPLVPDAVVPPVALEPVMNAPVVAEPVVPAVAKPPPEPLVPVAPGFSQLASEKHDAPGSQHGGSGVGLKQLATIAKPKLAISQLRVRRRELRCFERFTGSPFAKT